MTTRDDLHDVEARLRTALRERAGDVETTPVLHERVQRQAARGTWMRRGALLAGAAAAVVATVTVVPALLPDPTPIDIADTPEDAQPSEVPTAEEETQPAVPVPGEGAGEQDPFIARGLAFAEVLPDGTGQVVLADRTVSTGQPVTSLAGDRFGAMVVAGLEDGSIMVIAGDSTGGVTDQVIPAAANGSSAVPTPDGDGVAWLEGSELHVLPLVGDSVARVLPLEGTPPDDLRIEQWIAQADAQVIVASAPGGGLWSIPMDDSNTYNTAPTTPAFMMAGDAVDSVWLDTLQQVELAPGRDRITAELRFDGDPSTTMPSGLQISPDVRLTAAGDRVVVHDSATGEGVLYIVDGTEVDSSTFSWNHPTYTAVAPLAIVDVSRGGPDAPTGDGAAALGLPTDAPVIGTSGVELVIRHDDGTVERREVYPAGESEAALGRIAVRPGSTPAEGLVAVESFSEGETSIRLVALVDGGTSLVGDTIVTDGPLTGLVWSEDGTRIAWTDTAGLHESPLSDSGGLGGELLVEDTGPVVDWVWTQDDGVEATGHLTTLVNGGTGVELLGIDRAADGTVTMTGPAGGGDRVVLSTHASPGTATSPTVVADVAGGGAQLTWFADGDQDGTLDDPGVVGGDVRVEASGGVVLVLGMQRQVVVTFDGDVTELPAAADWDVVD